MFVVSLLASRLVQRGIIYCACTSRLVLSANTPPVLADGSRYKKKRAGRGALRPCVGRGAPLGGKPAFYTAIYTCLVSIEGRGQTGPSSVSPKPQSRQLHVSLRRM